MSLPHIESVRRTLFQTVLTRALSTLPVLGIVTLLAAASSSAMADPHQRHNGPRFNPAYHASNVSFNTSLNRSYNRDFRHHVNSANRHYSRTNTWPGNNSWRSNRFDRNRNHYVNRGFNNRFYDNRSRYRPSRHDHWSVSLNFGSGYSSWSSSSSLFTNGFYAGIGNRYYLGNSYGSRVLGSPLRHRTAVVYNQPTVIYVNDSSRVTGQINGRGVSRPARRSLLRDIHGDCYERTYDSQGRETRIPLPASACNF